MDSHSEFATGACAGYEAVLEDYLNGELHGAVLRKVAAHVKSCESCSAALEDAAAANRWIRETEVSSQPGPAFAATVMARVRIQQEESRQERASFWERINSLAWKLAATSAVALLLMLSFASRRSAAVPNDSVSVASPNDDVSDMFVAGHSSVPDTRWELFMAPEEGENGTHH